jgi:hypothetical protein
MGPAPCPPAEISSDVKVCVLPDSYVEVLTPNVTVLGIEPLEISRFR